MGLLEGKTVLITGASRGIGKGVALKLAGEGANIAFTYAASADKAKEVEEELRKLGANVKAYQSDAAQFDQAHDLVDHPLYGILVMV